MKRKQKDTCRFSFNSMNVINNITLTIQRKSIDKCRKETSMSGSETGAT